MWWPFSIPEPHDARVLAAQLNGSTGPPGSTQAAPASESLRPRSYATPPPEPRGESRWHTLYTSSRSRQQFSIFVAGAAFVALSSLVTRRALTRKLASVKPAGLFSPSNEVRPVAGSLDAAEALGLATLNVTSFGVMMAGGGLWAFDISSLDELRAKVRRGMELDDDTAGIDKEAEENMEEWMAVVLARMQGKNDRDIEAMVKEVQQKGQFGKP